MKLKLKLDSKKWISLLLLIITIGSTAAYGVIESFAWKSSTPATVQLPSSNIVMSALTTAQENEAVRQGKTVLEYRYPLVCSDCANQKAYLEFLVGEFPAQLLLEELTDTSLKNSTLNVVSYYGVRPITGPSQAQIFDALCDMMAQPPVTCATRNA